MFQLSYLKQLVQRLQKSSWATGLAILTVAPMALAQPTGYCTTNIGGACGMSDANISAVSIAGTTLNNPNSTCNTVNGSAYTLFPTAGNTTASLSPGSSYPVSVTTTRVSIISVWGDWNQNGLLETSEWTQISTSATADVAATATVVVPAGAPTGITRLRVRSRASNNPNGAADACTLFSSGETEDYNVSIGPPPACAAPINLNVGNISATTATANFSGASNGTAVGYIVQYGPAGFTPGGANSFTANTTSTSAPLSGLTANTAYEFYVTKDCGGGATSTRNGPFAFSTACVATSYAILPVNESFENAWVTACTTRDAPTPAWRTTPTTGNSSWRRNDDGAAAAWTNAVLGSYTPTGSQGTHSARFHSYGAAANAANGGKLDLYVDLSGGSNKVLQFDYLNTLGNDSLFVQVSNDGGGTFGPNLARLGLSGTGWATRVVNFSSTSATAVVRFQTKVTTTFTSDIGLDNVRLDVLSGVPSCATNLAPASGSTGVQRPVTLTWQDGGGVPTGYDVYFGSSVGGMLLVSSNQSATSYVVTASLAGNTTYYYQIVPRNANGPATGCAIASFTTSNLLVYCATNLGAFCGPGYANISAVYIAGTTLNNPNTLCNAATGYTLWPATGNTTAVLPSGSPYQVSVISPDASSIAVWGDWNQNGTFEASEWTQIATAATAGQPATATVNVPATALLGQTYLRVRSRLAGAQNGAGDACTMFGSGETEDYIVTIAPTPACTPPTNLTITGVTTSSATLTFSGNGTAVGYVVQYGLAGFTPGGVGSNTITTTSTTVPLAGLALGTPYQVYVTQDCGGGISSAATGPLAFSTAIANDEPCTGIVLAVNSNCQPTSATLAGATATASSVFAGGTAGTGCGVNIGAPIDVWFRFTTAATGPTSTAVRISVTGGAASVVRIYRGTACTGLLTFIACTGTGSNMAAPNLDVTSLIPNTTYFLQVHTYGTTDALGSFTICASSIPNCPAPVAPIVGTLTDTSAQLSWSGTPAAGSTYTVIYGPVGFNPATSGTSVTGITGLNTTLTGLSQATSYDYYLQQVCAGFNGSSILVGPVSFTTLSGNDEPCSAVPLGSAPLAGSTQAATTSIQPGITLPACSPSQFPRDVWFTMTPLGSSIVLTITGTAAGMVRLFTTADCTNGPLVPVSCQAATGDNIGFSTPLTFTGLVPGQRYYVAVSGYGSNDTPGNFTIGGSLLSSHQAVNSTALLVYPNPSNAGQFMLHFNGRIPAQATLLNALGQTVGTLALEVAGEHIFRTPTLAAGVYTLRVQTGSETLTRKVVLE